jgi:energy-coupling factor transport system ATP-binding protein
VGLNLDSIGYTYGAGTSFAQCALSGVSLEVEQGEFVLVLGATGSGKSTLLRICAGLLQATEGSVRLDDSPLTKAAARGRIGLVFQDAESQLFSETLAADVGFGPRNLGISEEDTEVRTRDALQAVGLPFETYGERSPFALSGGEARRGAIAGILAMRPSYLLLDEPTSGLDARGRRAIREVVRAARSTAGVILVSHSAEEFLGEADRVLVLSHGSVAFFGPAADIVEDPSPFADAGLVAPDVLRFQLLARERGCDPGAFTLDPERAAANIAAAGGWR